MMREANCVVFGGNSSRATSLVFVGPTAMIVMIRIEIHRIVVWIWIRIGTLFFATMSRNLYWEGYTHVSITSVFFSSLNPSGGNA
jgi:hypothetical protein